MLNGRKGVGKTGPTVNPQRGFPRTIDRWQEGKGSNLNALDLSPFLRHASGNRWLLHNDIIADVLRQAPKKPQTLSIYLFTGW